MQVKETLVEGLKREYEVIVPAGELDQRVTTRLNEMKDRVNIAGFRPGKVPLPHLKRVYGRSVMGEVIQQAVNETNQKIVDDGGFKLALEPQVTLAATEETDVKQLVEGKSDLAFKVAMEILPKIDFPDFKNIKVTREAVEPTDADVEETLGKIAESNRVFATRHGKAESGDRVTIDFKGSVDGQLFEGGSAEEVPLVLGSGNFIPGFEEQLIGAAAGDKRTVNVTFPAEYNAPHLAGKAAAFEVAVKNVEAPQETKIDEDFAKTLGLESLDKLKAQVRDKLKRDYATIGRAKVKRELLDALDGAMKFEAPPSLLEQEFGMVWSQVEEDMKQRGKTFADEDTTEEEARADYRGIADRRVRLGLAIAELGEKNNIKVSEDEVTRALVERARQFPGQEQQVWDHFRNNPQALAGVRAPLFEEKVVDFLLELVNVTEKRVSREELLKSDEEEGDAKPKAGKTGKKSKAKSKDSD